MKVYLLISDWMHNGNNAVNEVAGVYETMRKAQKALVESIYHDLQHHEYEYLKGDGPKPLTEYPIQGLAAIFEDNPEFRFDVTKASLWNGDEDISEDYQNYRIEEREVL